MSAIETNPGWEARMAQRARERRTATRAEELANDPHGLHHQHLRGSAVECSCGEFRGVTTVLFPDDYDPDRLVCELCGTRGVAWLRPIADNPDDSQTWRQA